MLLAATFAVLVDKRYFFKPNPPILVDLVLGHQATDIGATLILHPEVKSKFCVLTKDTDYPMQFGLATDADVAILEALQDSSKCSQLSNKHHFAELNVSFTGAVVKAGIYKSSPQDFELQMKEPFNACDITNDAKRSKIKAGLAELLFPNTSTWGKMNLPTQECLKALVAGGHPLAWYCIPDWTLSLTIMAFENTQAFNAACKLLSQTKLG